jgi:carboxymethylenebutenolidase
MKQISIPAADGACPAFTVEPASGSGPWPAVLMFIDGIGMRPALYPIAQRIADAGYFVLMPDVFYRAGAYTSPDPKALFSDPEVGKAWFTKVGGIARPATVMTDVPAFFATLDAEPKANAAKIGTTGYCMGAGLSFATAGTFPERVVAAAGFHPGNIINDMPTSVDKMAPKTKARVYVGGAADDPHFNDEMKAKVEAAYASAGVPHTVVTYPAKHGWVPSDTPVHDPVQAERHFEALFDLFKSTLG